MKSTANSLEMMRLSEMREEDKDRLIQRLQVGRPLPTAQCQCRVLSQSRRAHCTAYAPVIG